MTDKTQIEKDVAQARAKLAKVQAAWDALGFNATERACHIALTNLKVVKAELYDLLSSPAFAAQFDELLKEYIRLLDKARELGGVSTDTIFERNRARARLREFVLGESK